MTAIYCANSWVGGTLHTAGSLHGMVCRGYRSRNRDHFAHVDFHALRMGLTKVG